MSVYNIMRKHEILETNPKVEEIINFYLIFLCILVLLQQFLLEELSVFCFHGLYFLLVGLLQIISVSRYQYGFTLVGYRNGKSATNPALLSRHGILCCIK